MFIKSGKVVIHDARAMYLLLFSLLCQLVTAEELVDSATHSLPSSHLRAFYVDVVSEYQIQQLNNGLDDVEVFSLTLSPSWYGENVWLSLELPWYQASNDQFVSDIRAVNAGENLDSFCNRYASAGPLLKANLEQNRPRLVALCNALASANTASSSDSVSGWGDISFYLGYDLPIDTFYAKQGMWYLSGIVGYKFDNGDQRESLGSATQEVIAGSSITYSGGRYRASLAVDYAVVVGGEYQALYDDFGSFAAATGYRLQQNVWLGVEVLWQQAYDAYSDDSLSASYSMRWRLAKPLQLTIEYSDYYQQDTVIDGQFAASLAYSF